MLDEKQIELKMFCKFCGKEIEQNINNCVQCSANLSEKDKENKEFDNFIEKLFLDQKLSDELNKDNDLK